MLTDIQSVKVRLVVVALASMGIVGGPVAAIATEEAVKETVTRYHKALAAGDGEAARALLGDGLVVLESGYFETAEEYLSHHLGADMAFASAVSSERDMIRVTINGDVAWTASTFRTKGTYKGRDIDSVTVELMVLTMVGDEWKIQAIHWSSRDAS